MEGYSSRYNFNRVLATLNNDNLSIMTNICNDIYNTGFIPKEMKQSIFVPIQKTPNSHCSHFRTISLTSRVAKLSL